jgi:hypothetical protein
MAFDPTPSAFFGAGYTEDGTTTTHKLQLNSSGHTTPLLAEVTEAEADPTTGDWRKIIFGLIEMIYQKFIALAEADKPNKVNLTRSSSINETTGEITRFYTFTFKVAPSGIEVNAEA